MRSPYYNLIDIFKNNSVKHSFHIALMVYAADVSKAQFYFNQFIQNLMNYIPKPLFIDENCMKSHSVLFEIIAFRQTDRSAAGGLTFIIRVSSDIQTTPPFGKFYY